AAFDKAAAAGNRATEGGGGIVAADDELAGGEHVEMSASFDRSHRFAPERKVAGVGNSDMSEVADLSEAEKDKVGIRAAQSVTNDDVARDGEIGSGLVALKGAGLNKSDPIVGIGGAALHLEETGVLYFETAV